MTCGSPARAGLGNGIGEGSALVSLGTRRRTVENSVRLSWMAVVLQQPGRTVALFRTAVAA
jgi:hypothetical protein